MHVWTIRPWVRPNYKFMEQLLEWEMVVRPHSEGAEMEGLKGAVRLKRGEQEKGR